MATTSLSSSPVPRRRLGLRYSLRALLILLTLCCLAVAYWYRWPFAKEVVHEGRGIGLWVEGIDQVDGRRRHERSKITHVAKETQRFRRVLRGKPIREGMTELFDADGKRIGEERWIEGARHGLGVHYYPTGEIRAKHPYQRGEPHGVWEDFDRTGNVIQRAQWSDGIPHGTWEWLQGGKVQRTLKFDQGETTEVDGRRVSDQLGRAARGKAANQATKRIFEACRKRSWIEFRETPVNHVVDWYAETYGINATIDRRRMVAANILPNTPVSATIDNVPVNAALLLILEPHGLAATYRFDVIWITTKDDAETWRDRTGIPELTQSPPPGATADDGRKIERELDRQAVVEFVDTPLQDALQYFSEVYKLTLKCEGADPMMPLNITLKGLSLRSTLGAILDQYALRIRWKEGTTLVVEPEETP